MWSYLAQPQFEAERVQNLFDHLGKERFKDLLCRGSRPKLENVDMNFTRIEIILNSTCSALLDGTGDTQPIDPKDIFFAIFGLLIPLPIVVGNVLIIFVFGWHLPREQRHSDMFVINMAVADLLVGLLMPFDAAFHIEPRLRGCKYACFAWMAWMVVALGESFLSLFAISLDRFIAVYYPLKYSRCVNRKRVNFAVGISWMSVTAISFMPLLGKCISKT